MGSSSKKYKDKESRKRRHRSRSRSYEDYEIPKEKKHKHKRHHHHKERKREKAQVPRHEYESDGSDVVEIISESPPPTHPVEKVQALRSTERTPVPRSSDRSQASRSTDRAQVSRPADRTQITRSVEKTQTQRSTERVQPSRSESGGQSVESLSVEESNRLRAKLGLKPLDVGTASNNSYSTDSKKKDDGKKKDDLGEFYHKPAENIQEKVQQEKMRAKLAEIKEKRQLQNKYSKLKTLGESDSEDDMESWIDKNRKIEHAKKEAEKRARMLEELDAQFGISEVVQSEQREKMRHKYTEKDLTGLTVQHDIQSFAEERSVILTLKDKGVLDEDEDVLVNVNMLDNERYKKVKQG